MKTQNLNNNLVYYFIVRTLSQFIASMYLIALPLYVLKITNRLAISGLFFACMSIPSIILTPFIGPIIEQQNKKKLTSILLIFLMIMFVIITVLKLYNNLSFLFIFSAIVQLLYSLFDICTKVLFSEIVSKELLEHANGLKSFLDNCSSVIAPIIGTLIFGIIGFEIILFIASVIYVIGFIFSIRIESMVQHNTIHTIEKQNYIRSLKEGVIFIYNNKEIWYLFILVMSLNFFVANFDEVINPGILIQRFHINDTLYGFSSTAMVLGTLIAGLFIFKNQKFRLNNKRNILFILNSVLMILIGILSKIIAERYKYLFFIIFLVLQCLIGFISTCINVPLSSYLQTTIPSSMQARFFSLLSFSANLLIPLGISYTGFLSELIGADIAYIINNTLVIIIVVLVMKKERKPI